MPSETPLIYRIRLLASRHGARLFRNHTGRMKDKDGRWHAFGLTVGGSDLVGWTADGRFLAIEVKAGETKTTPEQLAFIAAVNKAGGIAGVVRSEVEAEELLAG